MGNLNYVADTEALNEEAKLQEEISEIDVTIQDPHDCICKDCNCQDEIPE
jgi:hypothetical protein